MEPEPLEPPPHAARAAVRPAIKALYATPLDIMRIILSSINVNVECGFAAGSAC